MQVQVIPFGVLKDWLGSSPATVELPSGSTVAQLLELLSATCPSGQPGRWRQSIAVSVNAEYSTAGHVLQEGDEVGLLPPVSGGTAPPSNESGEKSAGPTLLSLLTREPIQTQELVASAKSGEDGAVVVFDGMVRDNSRGRPTLYLDYEAYEELAIRQMKELVHQAIGRFAIRDAWIVHRLGRLQIGETSVLIVVASAHRAPAFEACRWLIDTLKKTVPIWKKETFQDGAVWAAGEPFPAEFVVEDSDET